MFGLSLGEMLVLGTIALIAIDPKDLPKVARTIGKFLNEMKRATGDLTKNITDVRDDAKSQFGDARKSMNDVFSGVTSTYVPQSQTIAPTTAPLHVDAPDAQMAFSTDSNAPIPVVSPIELTPAPDPVEEQLVFQLTNFDDETRGHS